MMITPKIIVLGGPSGRLSAAFAKLATLQAKNNFTLALITGNLFGDSEDKPGGEIADLLSGAIQVPLSTYFTVGTAPFPAAIAERLKSDRDICPNLHFLGQRSVTKTTEGVRIVALGGNQRDVANPAEREGEAVLLGGEPERPAGDVFAPLGPKELESGRGADVLITAAWPTGIWSRSRVPLDVSPRDIPSSQGIAAVCAELKPRYHFCASPGGSFFFEREPFVHPAADEGGGGQVTRFISVAGFGNSAEAKAMYGFTLPPVAGPPDIPPGATSSPFSPVSKKRSRDEAGFSRFSSDGMDGDGGGHRQRRRRNRSPPPGPDRCFFCLGNPNLSVHMCASIGNESYLATAKGPLTTSATYQPEGLDFPGHFIVIPLAHTATVAGLSISGSEAEAERDHDPAASGAAPAPALGSALKTHAEMTRFREAVQAAVAAASKHRLGVVTWEISRGENIHVHWQLLAVPVEQIRKGLVEAAFRVEAENMKYAAPESRELSVEEQARFGPFFRVWIWADDGGDRIEGQSLVMRLEPEARFDLQFGRRVMAKLLGLERRFSWKDCEQPKAEEERDVAAFRKAFGQWDFTAAEE